MLECTTQVGEDPDVDFAAGPARTGNGAQTGPKKAAAPRKQGRKQVGPAVQPRDWEAACPEELMHELVYQIVTDVDVRRCLVENG